MEIKKCLFHNTFVVAHFKSNDIIQAGGHSMGHTASPSTAVEH